MEVKIGVQHAQRELVLDTDSTPDDIEARLTEALAGNGVLRLADIKGRTRRRTCRQDRLPRARARRPRAPSASAESHGVDTPTPPGAVICSGTAGRA